MYVTSVNGFMCRCETMMSVHITLLHSITSPEALLYIPFTLAHATEQIHQQNLICMPNYTNTQVYM